MKIWILAKIWIFGKLSIDSERYQNEKFELQEYVYFRWKLNERYGNERVSGGNDPVPEHIFGNMWAQGWSALYDIAAPFPNAGASPDATPAIEGLTIEEMWDYSDDFFRSLGMTPMTKLFWRNSVLERRTDVEAMVN